MLSDKSEGDLETLLLHWGINVEIISKFIGKSYQVSLIIILSFLLMSFLAVCDLTFSKLSSIQIIRLEQNITCNSREISERNNITYYIIKLCRILSDEEVTISTLMCMTEQSLTEFFPKAGPRTKDPAHDP